MHDAADRGALALERQDRRGAPGEYQKAAETQVRGGGDPLRDTVE